MNKVNEDRLKYKTEKDVIEKAKTVINKPFKEYPHFSTYTKNGKGYFGQLVEIDCFDMKPDTISGPDFPIPGIELKVTGYYRMANDLMKAKERLVLNMINYEKEEEKCFEESSFINKNKKIELMCYEAHKDRSAYPISDWYISHQKLIKFDELPDEDKAIIIQDYNTIINKIKMGLAHEISEGDTLYLAACRKGANGDDKTTQPNSEIPAKPRAFSYKPSYLTKLLNEYVNDKKYEITSETITNSKELKEKTFEEIIYDKIKPYINKSKDELLNTFNLKNSNKAVNATIISKILGLSGNINNTEEFKKANITVKTVVQNYNSTVTESMSFSAFNPFDFEDTEWLDSDFYNEISNKFLFIIFQKDNNDNQFFKGIKFWSMPFSDIKEAAKVWNITKEIFTTHTLIIEKRGNRNHNNLPSKSENRVCHVRPHARDSEDTYMTPQGTMLTKQCFWLNNTYIAKIINE